MVGCFAQGTRDVLSKGPQINPIGLDICYRARRHHGCVRFKRPAVDLARDDVAGSRNHIVNGVVIDTLVEVLADIAVFVFDESTLSSKEAHCLSSLAFEADVRAAAIVPNDGHDGESVLRLEPAFRNDRNGAAQVGKGRNIFDLLKFYRGDDAWHSLDRIKVIADQSSFRDWASLDRMPSTLTSIG